MPRRLWVLPALLSLLTCAPAGAQTDSTSLTADKAALRAAGLDTDGPGLLAYVKKRTLVPAMRTRIAGLIKDLASEEFDEREKASEALVEIGLVARPQLRQATRDRDPEVRRRARRALVAIGPSSDSALLPAAARVLANPQAARALEAPLEFPASLPD